MLVIVGLVVVFGAVVGGFLMAGGELMVLNQPSEFVVIGGAALGSLLISTPMGVLKQILAADQGPPRRGAGKSTTTSTCWRCCTRSSSRCSSPA